MANKGKLKDMTAKFAPKRNWPYAVRAICSLTSYKVEGIEGNAIGGYYVQDLHPYHPEDSSNDVAFVQPGKSWANHGVNPTKNRMHCLMLLSPLFFNLCSINILQRLLRSNTLFLSLPAFFYLCENENHVIICFILAVVK